MAYGLPVEGEAGPFAGSAVVDPVTAAPDERASVVAERLRGAGGQRAVVVDDERVVLGLVARDTLEDASTPETVVAAVMAVIPSTVRPSVPVAELAEGEEAALVTDSAGRLLGVVEPGPQEETEKVEAATEQEAEMKRLEDSVLEIVHDAEEHFGDRAPSEEEMRGFLHQRLVAEGRTAEEAEAYLEAMDRDQP